MTLLMSSFSCNLLKDRILDGWTPAQCGGVMQYAALILSAFSVAIFIFIGVFSS